MRCRICDAADLVRLGPVRGYDFVECPRCGFAFTPAVTTERMAELYRAGYHGPAEGAPEQGWADPRFLEPALEHLGPDRRLQILDFGTGQSRVPEVLREWGHRVLAVDVVPPRRPHPDRRTGTLRSLRFEPDRFDLSFTFQVFEHLPEPRGPLEELLRITRPGGLVVIHTDMEVQEREDGFTRWWYVLPPDHCAFYRHRTFEVLLEGTAHRVAWCDPKCVMIEVGVEHGPCSDSRRNSQPEARHDAPSPARRREVRTG